MTQSTPMIENDDTPAEPSEPTGSNVGAELTQPVKSKGDEHADHMQAAFYLSDADNDYITAMPGQYAQQIPVLLNALVERAYRKGQEDLGYVQGELMPTQSNEAEFERGRMQGRKDMSPVQ